MKGKILKLSFDFVLAAASTWMAFFLYYHGHVAAYDEIMFQSLLFAAFFTAFSVIFGTHRTVWRYTSTEDLLDILGAAMLAVFTFGVYQHFYIPEIVFKPTFAITQSMCLLGTLAGQRLTHRFLHEGLSAQRAKSDNTPRSRVLLVGAGPAADKFVRAVRANPHYGYEIVGVVDNDRTLFADRLHGVPILGKGKHLERILSELREQGRAPQRLVFTETALGTGSADLMDIPADVLQRAEDFGLRLSRLPDLTSFREGLDPLDDEGGTRLSLKPIAIEDLLGRPQASLDMKSIRALIEGKRVIITGAGGSIGGELSRQIAALQPS